MEATVVISVVVICITTYFCCSEYCELEKYRVNKMYTIEPDEEYEEV